MNISHGQCHYRCSIDVKNTQNSPEAWSYLLRVIRDWIARRPQNDTDFYGSWYFTGGDWSSKCPKKVRVITNRYIGCGDENTPEYWSVRYIHSCDEFPHKRWWQTDIGITSLRDSIFRFNLNVLHCLKSGFIGKEPDNPIPTTPYVVKRLLTSRFWECYIGGEQLSLDVKPLKVGDGEDLRRLLQSGNRHYPIVVIARDFYTNSVNFPSEQLASHLGGVASVYVSESKELDKELECCLGWKFSCWNGMIRIYQPGVDFNAQKNARRHRFFKKEEIEKQGAENIIEMIVRGICRRNTHLIKRGVFSIDDVRAVQRDQRVLELKKSLQDNDLRELCELLFKENEELNRKNKYLTEDNEYYQVERDELEDKISRLTYDKQSTMQKSIATEREMRELQSKIKVLDELTELPNSIEEVIDILTKIHSDKIVFTEKGIKSVETCPLKDISILWKCLWSIATDLHNLLFDEVNKGKNIEQEFQNKTSFELTFKEGHMTQKDRKLMKMRQDTYNGEEINITPHVKYGNKKPKLLRVHFYPCHKTKKIVIGYCGDHLENRTSKSMK